MISIAFDNGIGCGTNYFYIKNLQGDVTNIVDSTGSIKVTYTYDSWGKIKSTTDTSGLSLGSKNPFRYRSYYYDTDLALYYLQSRYYDPNTGRFINADGYVSTGTGILGYNMFAYCDNNPINYFDYLGLIPMFVFETNLFSSPEAIINKPITFTNPFTDIAFPTFPTTVSTPLTILTPNLANVKPFSVLENTSDNIGIKVTVSSDTITDAGSSIDTSSVDINKYTPKPIAGRHYYNSRKEAKEAATRAGGGKPPRLDPPKMGRPPHYHPNVDNAIKKTPNMITKHDHYFFPKSQFSFVSIQNGNYIIRWCE